MQLGMIGLGRMGANMVRRLVRNKHTCVVYDRNPASVTELASEGAQGAASLAELVQKLSKPRAVWLMVPAAVVDASIRDLVPLLEKGDVLIDGGNSYYVDDIRRAKELAAKGIHYVDVGTSGGVWGLDRGYCMMIGGEPTIVQHLDPLFMSLAPGIGDIPRTPGRERVKGTAEQGYLHCGPNGAGHFVKMVHNGIEYGLMAAYAEGMGILRAANVGKETHAVDAETTRSASRRTISTTSTSETSPRCGGAGSVIASWLLDLTAISLLEDPSLGKFAGRVSDSGEGRWTILAAVDEAVPAPVLTARCTRASARVAKRTSRTSCSRRCGISSADTWKKPPTKPVFENGERDGRHTCRCTRVLRGDGRSGLQEDLSVAAGDGQARDPRCARHRCGQGRLDP